MRLFLCVPLLFALGCSGGLKVVPMEGKLTLDGAPVKDASLTFMPSDAGGQTAVAATGSEGTFRAMTGNAEGIMPGKYRVVVAVSSGSPATTNAGGEINSADYAKAMSKAMKAPAKSKSDIPAKYTQPSETPLQVTVDGSGLTGYELKMMK